MVKRYRKVDMARVNRCLRTTQVRDEIVRVTLEISNIEGSIARAKRYGKPISQPESSRLRESKIKLVQLNEEYVKLTGSPLDLTLKSNGHNFDK